MTDQETPPSAPPLSLGPNAAVDLNAPAPLPHFDSKEYLRNTRHRVAQELGDISGHDASPSRPNALRARPSHDTLTVGGSSAHRSRASTTTDVSGREAPRRRHERRQQTHWYDGIVKFWTQNVSVTIEGDPRDHLALERTFLGYLRTSLALAMIGVVTAQLFRLQHSLSPNPSIGYFVLGVPLAASFIVLGMVVLLVGAIRCWRQQSAMVRGKVYAGGWEITGIMVLSVLVSVLLFVALCLG
ncbi:hypothetical protein BU23DRAFT_552552 [Bimuria novae-zelandiae CBS 107.79]|uniref:DUF202 domain-containing protein n=1 Tax=Bimuria novae-zelandiae CBS 107.79 TaxID=1447943 RepID=A0A6A5VE91_9PLEO|nr:hypothetical protein BU23DRAFT_552552 [Bimuria novae-zelandiae CBS 107.79]